jgi:hypothetical protein
MWSESLIHELIQDVGILALALSLLIHTWDEFKHRRGRK